MKPSLIRILLPCCMICGLLSCDAPPDLGDIAELQENGVQMDTTPQRSDVITMTGIRLYLHDTAPTAGRARKPRFMVEADTSSMESDDSWSFEEARAVLYNSETEEEDIIFQAGEGRFIENREAYLGGGVEADAGNVTIRMTDIVCENLETDEGIVAYTNHPVSIDSPDLELDAAKMQIHPDNRTMEFQQVSGWIRFGSLNP